MEMKRLLQFVDRIVVAPQIVKCPGDELRGMRRDRVQFHGDAAFGQRLFQITGPEQVFTVVVVHRGAARAEIQRPVKFALGGTQFHSIL